MLILWVSLIIAPKRTEGPKTLHFTRRSEQRSAPVEYAAEYFTGEMCDGVSIIGLVCIIPFSMLTIPHQSTRSTCSTRLLKVEVQIKVSIWHLEHSFLTRFPIRHHGNSAPRIAPALSRLSQFVTTSLTLKNNQHISPLSNLLKHSSNAMRPAHSIACDA